MNHTLCTNCGRNPAKEYVRKSEGKELKLFLCPSCYEALYPDAGEDDFFTSFLGNVGAKKSCPACGTQSLIHNCRCRRIALCRS
ncbi:MAG: hypothetical protein K2K12_06225, partial [Clostridia bacterium]|nr:hypothetical protein [Clostridia bacterium]